MGSDSFAGDAVSGETLADPKIAVRNGWLFGIAGSSRVAGLVEHVFRWPKMPRVVDEGAVVRLARAMEKLVGKDEMCLSSEHGQRALAAEMLVAGRGRVYLIASDLAPVRFSHGYGATGCGAPFALGALAVMSPTVPPKERVIAALKAAARHSGAVRPPFHVLEQPA